MGEDRPEPSVQYLPEGSSVKLLERFNGQSASSKPRKPPKTHSGRKTALRSIKIALPVCLIIAGPALTFYWLRHIEQGSSPGEKSSYSILGDVTNLTLESGEGSSFTVSCEPPQSPIDYYLVELTVDSDQISGNNQTHLRGSCAKGTIVHPDQTRITCSLQGACAKASFTVRAYSKGPPEVMSRGSIINGIIIAGRAPDPPINLNISSIATSLTRLQWEPPQKFSGTIGEYTVKVCDNSTLCEAQERLSGCIERQTLATWLEFESRVSTTYCALVTVTAMCGTDVLRSRQATLEFRTPLFDLPDVADLRLVSATENSFTVTWERPDISFDYYRIEVTTDSGNRSTQAQPHRVGSCASGTIIHPDQMRVTCSLLHACTNASFIVHTYRRGPPELTSLGVTLHDIFIPGQDPDPPGTITIIQTSPSLTRLQWKSPTKVSGSIHSYALKVCSEFTLCNVEATMRGCTDYDTSETWLEFSSTADTSYCALARVSTQCGWNVRWSPPTATEFRTPSFVLPDVVKLHLVSTAANSFTAAWQRPDARFDYFTIEVAVEKAGSSGPSDPRLVGPCASGTIIHPNQTSITCNLLEACTTANITVRTYRSGPPVLSSLGVSLQDIFIPGEEPDPPRSLTTMAKSPSLCQVQWEPPVKSSGHLVGFTARVCAGYTSCDAQQIESECTEHQTSDTLVEFESTVDTPYCVQVTSRARCGLDELSSVPIKASFWTPLFALPDVANLSLVSAGDRSFTVSWRRPETRFDYYKIEATGDNGYIDRGVAGYRSGSCSKDTILQLDQTQVTCSNFNACTTASFTLRTYRRGPPELTSSGVTLSDIFIPSQDLDPPTNITMTVKSASLTRLQWEAPAHASGSPAEYSVKVCDTFASCDPTKNLTGCTNHRTSATWLEFPSTVGTGYCVQVTARAWCGADVITSRPAVAEIKTPLLVLPEVTNLSLLDVAHNYFTASWERPKRRLDYYWLELKGLQGQTGNEGQHLTGSCADGSILRPDQTRVTCIHLPDCSNLTFTVRTHIHGPPERTSLGATLDGIFIPGRDPDPPKNISMLAKSPLVTLLRWDPPAVASANVDAYSVKICDHFALCDEKSVGGCKLFKTSQASVEFASTRNTLYCVFITATARCGSGVLRSRPAVTQIKTPSFDPPDPINVRLEAVTPDSFTVGWMRPEGMFDSFWAETMVDRDGSGAFEYSSVGSCAHGSYLPDSQTQVTCDKVKPCTSIRFTLHTLVKGPPQRTSRGVNITSISIPGKAPEPPRNISASRTEASVQLEWKEPPTPVSVYLVKVCDWCVRGDPEQCCWAKETTSPFLVFNHTEDEDYSVHVSAGASCRSDITWSKPTAQEFVSVLPDVTNLRLAAVTNDSFTVTWHRPKSRFHYYLVKVNEYNTGSSGGSYHSVRSCTNNTIIHPNHTQVTCTGYGTWCGEVGITVHTHRDRPSERTSPGITLRGIYFAGKAEPLDVVDLKLAAVDSNSFTVDWKRPRDCFDSYLVEFIDENRSSGGSVQQRFGTCRNAIIGPEQTKITCTQLEACTNVSVRVRTQRDGPPTLTSPGVVQKGIFITGGAPESFSISARRESPNEAYVDIFVAKIPSCMLGNCTGVLKGSRYSRHFDCLPYIRTPATLRLSLSRDLPRRRYVIEIKLTNPHNGLSATKRARVGAFLE